MIDLSEGDDPELIEIMVHVMYHFDYEVPSAIEEDLSEIVLFHTGLFVLADKYDYPLLGQLAVYKIKLEIDPREPDLQEGLINSPETMFRVLPALKVIYSIPGGKAIKSILLEFVLRHFDALLESQRPPGATELKTRDFEDFMENCGAFAIDLAKTMSNTINRGRAMQGFTRFLCKCGLGFMLDLQYAHKALRRTGIPNNRHLRCLCPRCDKPNARATRSWEVGPSSESIREECWYEYKCQTYRNEVLCAHRSEDERKEDFSFELHCPKCDSEMAKTRLELADIWKYMG